MMVTFVSVTQRGDDLRSHKAPLDTEGTVQGKVPSAGISSVHTPVEHFAVPLLRTLTAGDLRATHFHTCVRGKTATIGITDDGV